MALQTPPPLHDIADAPMSHYSRGVVVRAGSNVIREASPARRSNGVCRAMHRVHIESR
jgi:hypothetical protein